MELSLIEILAIASIPTLGLASIFIIAKFKLNKPARTMKSQNQDAILDHYQTLITINEDQKTTINQIRGKLTRAIEKIGQLDGTMEDTEDQTKSIITPELISPIAKKLNMSPENLIGLLDSPQAKKFLGSKDNQELIKIVLPLLASKLGSSQSETSVQESNLPQTEIA